ncbi:MAG: zinc ribbon domain-containing protein [Coriobacteriia bacterium]|nr:zinc ribbon domain-containing protein [Coriobacteriia bacterium]
MTQGPVAYCTSCGTPLTSDDRFCTKCGAAREPMPAAAQAPTFAQQAGHAAQTARQTYGTVAQVAGVAGMAASLPWQTIVVGETPDLRAMLSRAAVPGARVLAQRSLKKPGLAMAVTVGLDLLVAGLSGGGSALAGALPRVLAGGTTALLSLITGTKGGALRSITGVVSLVTALVQVISLGVTIIGGLRSGMPFLSTLSMVVAMASALVMAIKTASVALRRRS